MRHSPFAVLLPVAAAVSLSFPSADAFAKDKVDPKGQIKLAMSAAPKFISEKATIMTWDDRKVLRAGTNAYFCFPNFLGTKYPMCVEQAWIDLLEALALNKVPPKVQRVHVGYWLRGATPGESNDDPFAPMTHNHAKVSGEPHLAIIVPDIRAFEGVSSDPQKGEPWVMYKNTPYVHLMVPAPAAASR